MGFSADWLRLRESADHAARAPALLSAAAGAAGTAPVIVDLGAGTGSTCRAFNGHLPGDASWHLVDHDADLLQIAQLLEPKAQTHRLDMGDLAHVPFGGANLVTASALLDLVAEDWLDELVAHLAQHTLPFYAALSYDGVMRWDVEHRDDAAVTEAFNSHQRRNKGLGAALGPQAVARATSSLSAQGYAVHCAASPWRLDAGHAELQEQLFTGIAEAAQEAGFDRAQDWLSARLEQIPEAGCLVGHIDLLALPKTQAG